MYFVYVLKSLKDGNFYIGRTKNFERRFKEHNSGKVQSTKSRIPFILLEKIEVSSEEESIKLELKYKEGYKREKIKRKYGGVA
jgi:putative endonuclease